MWAQNVGPALGCAGDRTLGYDPTFAEYATLTTHERASATMGDHQAA